MTALIKRTVLRVSEPKCYRSQLGQVELFHNTFGVSSWFLLNSSSRMPTSGTSDTQRVGDQINISSFRMRMLIGQKADRPNVTFRWLVVSVPKGSTPLYTSWFIATTSNVLLDDPNKDFLKVHKQGIWRPNEAGLSGTGGDEYTFVKTLTVPYKKLLKFGPADNATSHNDDDLYFIIMAYDAYGSLQSDNIAYVQCALDMNYKDP